MTCPRSLELVSSGGKGTRAGSQVSTVEEMIPHQEVLGQRSAGAEEGPLEEGLVGMSELRFFAVGVVLVRRIRVGQRQSPQRGRQEDRVEDARPLALKRERAATKAGRALQRPEMARKRVLSGSLLKEPSSADITGSALGHPSQTSGIRTS